MIPTQLIAGGVTFDHLGKLVFVRFLQCKITICPLHSLLFGTKLLGSAQIQGWGGDGKRWGMAETCLFFIDTYLSI
jgi:hypothetical protein